MIPLPPSITHYISTIMPPMNGWCSPEKAASLASHVIASRPSHCLEIGVYAGRSLFAIALALLYNAHGHVLGIDPWSTSASVQGFESDPANRDWWARLDHDAIYQECERHRSGLNLISVTTLFPGTSAAAYPIIRFSRPDDAPFLDLLHIDGNHSEASALFDVESYVPLVRPGALVYFDDCDWSTTKRAQERLSDLCTLMHMVGNCGVYRRNPEGGDTP